MSSNNNKDLAFIYNEYSLTTTIYVEFDTPKEIFRGTIAELLKKINQFIALYGFCSYVILQVEEDD